MINLDRLGPAERATVERELAVRMRAEDGAFGSTTLRDLLAERAAGKTVASRGEVDVRVALIDWPGYEQPQALEVSRPLWESLDLPVVEPPAGLA